MENLLQQHFQLEAEIGRGGMGRVYCARDLHTHERVAVKVLSKRDETGALAREAKLLGSLSHPGIVSYIGQGLTLEGHAYLAMQWLEGEELAQRLRRNGLALHESLQLCARVAEALQAAHGHGIVHCDIKPANIFLRGGDPNQPVLIDFGIARNVREEDALAHNGRIVGTPQYMSPEQAQGGRHIGPASDVFSLGCVLFECIAGQPPFPGEHLAVVLGKLLYGRVPELRQVRPDVPAELAPLDALFETLLAKDPGARTQDAGELREALWALAPLPDLAAPVRQRAVSPVVRAAEQRIVAVVLVLPPGACGIELATAELEEPEEAQGPGTKPSQQFDTEALSSALFPIGLKLEPLADGSLLAVSEADSLRPMDQVLNAARGAFLMKDRMPQAQVVLGTGRALLHQRIPEGEVMERISGTLTQAESARFDRQNGVLCDAVSGNLLENRYALVRDGGVCLLQGELGLAEDARRLLGQKTPCVGRERELAQLEALFQQCTQERTARGALVLAPAGVGKSRLRQEFVRRLREEQTAAEIVIAGCDAQTAGVGYGIFAKVLQKLFGISPAQPLEQRQEQLQQRVATYFEGMDRTRVATFLGEVCGCRPDEQQLEPAYRLIQQDPRALNAQIERAVVDFFRAASQAQPLVLVLEDLHWGDLLSLRLVGEMLRVLQELPLFIVALARPEVKTLFSEGLSQMNLQELRLHRLQRPACERLIEHVLGSTLNAEQRAKMAEQAEGNALLLEELIRAAAEGRQNDGPATVLTILQARIDRLGSEPRCFLRYASVYGETFWKGGIENLLSASMTEEDAAPWLEELCQQEFIERRRESRFAEEEEYGFRHALVREAAYGLLLEEDRTRCHRAALEYLERKQEQDPVVLAWHAESGRQYVRAIDYYILAAHRAFERSDLARVDEYAERGLACGAHGESLGELRSIQAGAAFFKLEWKRILPLAEEAMQLLPSTNPNWYAALDRVLTYSYATEEQEQFTFRASCLLHSEPGPLAYARYARTLITAVAFCAQRGAMKLLYELGGLMEGLSYSLPKNDITHAFIKIILPDLLRSTQVDPTRQVESLATAMQLLDNIHFSRDYRITKVMFGFALAEYGNLLNSSKLIHETIQSSQSWNDSYCVMQSRIHLAALLVMSGVPADLAEAERLLEELENMPGLTSGFRGWGYGLSAEIAQQRGQAEVAEQRARQGLPLLERFPFRRLTVVTTLIATLRSQGPERLSEARREAEQALEQLHRLSPQSYPAIPLLVEVAQVRHAVGEEQAADRVLSDCLTELYRRANLIPNEAERQQFLQRIPAHRKALELAEHWQLAPPN